MERSKEHISVCICTYNRPALLARLLNRLEEQTTGDLFSYSIVVVDNDRNESAKATVWFARNNSLLDTQYCVEPEQNIALARNRAVESATGNLVAFIDDDEFPTSTWLSTLYAVYIQHGADGVLGPVLPYFEESPPEWLIRGKFCERKSHDSGKLLHWDETRTGNVLLKKEIFLDGRCRFDSRFGRSGGEDVEFFKIAIKSGRRFIWCNEAPVYETVPPERWTESFYVRRNLRIGALNGERKRKEGDKYKLLVKVIAATIIYSFLLPMSLVMGRHVFLKYAFKLVYNIAWLSGISSRSLTRQIQNHPKNAY
jgi:succinoglycan biosynthesis protein ExoM